jgi:ATP-binding cassette, subfamily F, member 3
MIQLTAAGKRFGPKLLFESLDWLITPKARLGLVGANGTGKSTLLKVLAGLEPLDYGTITSAKGIGAGYLPQDGLSLSGRTVLGECLSVFDDLRDMEREIETLTHRMAEVDPETAEYHQVSERYERLESQFRARGGYAVEAQAGMVLSGLGFAQSDLDRRTEEFSGGWQMRIALAKLLLQKPNLLLLDEPTNHLDLEARNWLEVYLDSYPHAYVLISHDRFFLDITVGQIAEIWNRRVHFYSGNYEHYLAQKSARRAQLEAAYKNQQEKIRQLETFINRFRYQATKAKQVQSRIKEIERMEKIELPTEEKTIHFSFRQPPASGRIVAEFRSVAKSYGPKLVFSGVGFVIERGERIALVGVNGAGKSTLIKLLAGLEPTSAGEYRLGHNAHPDYFAQDQYKALDPEARLLDDLANVAPRTQTELRSLLGCFLFSEDDVFKRIGVLSGGERNRYALARMLLRPTNFLLLDEPTNHLDMRAKDVLLDALEVYSGTLVFVSHDRYFIDKLATRVFEIGGGEVHVFPGNYEDYLWRKENGEPVAESRTSSVAPGRTSETRTTQAGQAGGVPAAEGATGQGLGTEAPANGPDPGFAAVPLRARRLNPIRLRQLEARCRELEQQVARCEAEISRYESELVHFKSAEETIRLTKLVEERRSELATLMKEWEEGTQTVGEHGMGVAD